VSTRTVIVILIIAVLAGLGISLWAGPRLPASVPTHWDASGQANGYSSPAFAMFFMPGLTLGIGLLLIFLPMVDPLRANVEKFRRSYNWAIVGFAAYMLYIHVLTLLAGLGVSYNMTSVLIPAMGLLFFGMGFLLERTQQNWFIGIRTPWTLSSPVVWEKTHRLGGLLFKIAGLLTLASLLFRPETAFLVMLVPLLLASLGTVVYSYFAFQQEKKGRP
jgi:uncharacterized membrane protein